MSLRRGWKRCASWRLIWCRRCGVSRWTTWHSLWPAVVGPSGPPDPTRAVWHLSFIYHWRAEHLGAQVAAGDYERAKGKAWAGFWDEEGRLKSLSRMDREMMRMNREDWREEAGLPPDGALWCP